MHMVTMGEAAHQLGISVDAIRQRHRRGQLKGHQQLTPQGYIWLIEVPEQHGGNTDVEHVPGEAPLGSASAPAGLSAVRAVPKEDAAPAANNGQAIRELVEVLRHEIESKDQQLNSKDRQIEQLHILLQQANSSPMPPGQLPSWDPGVTG